MDRAYAARHAPEIGGFASSLYDSESSFTLADFCRQKKLAYADLGLPAPLETFREYGLGFQRRFVPELENKVVVSVKRQIGEFTIRLADGETLAAKKIPAEFVSTRNRRIWLPEPATVQEMILARFPGRPTFRSDITLFEKNGL